MIPGFFFIRIDFYLLNIDEVNLHLYVNLLVIRVNRELRLSTICIKFYTKNKELLVKLSHIQVNESIDRFC